MSIKSYKTNTYVKIAGLALAMAIGGSAIASNEPVITKIHDVEMPVKSGDPIQILVENDGRVYSLESTNSALLSSLNSALANKANVELTIANDEKITAVKILPIMTAELAAPSADEFADVNFSDYQPTVLNSMADAARLYKGLNSTLRNRSQCFQRAMVWSYEMYQSYSIKSMKVFMFFTRAYRSQYNYKWWFHVAPYVMVGNEEVVLDYSFTENELTMKQWTDEFIYSKRDCLVARSYSEYESLNDRTSEHCILRKVPMYVHQPLDIEAVDSKGQTRTYFRQSDIENAYRAKSWW